MIDKDKFAAGLGVLANNFNKTVDAALSRVWYGVLSRSLTTEQFERAVALSIEQDTFWPTAASLIAKVAPTSPESDGQAALEHVNRVLSECGGHRFLSFDRYQEAFDAPTKAAILAVGGLPEITGCSVERYGALVKKFSAAYAKALSAPVALPATGTDNRVTELVGQTVRSLSLVDWKEKAARNHE
jgi:hypothetical protein